jgi:aspartate-semialdehyde dehydrogenase
MQTPYGEISIEEFTVKDARETDILIMAVSGTFAELYAPEICAEGGPVVIDNSSAFRYHEEIPLVVIFRVGLH